MRPGYLPIILQAKAIDDALELLDLLMVTELLGKAEQASDEETLRTHPRWPVLH